MSKDANEKVHSGEAWTEFCELLKKAGDVIVREDLDTTTFDRAEGHRYLGRLLRAGLFSFSETTGADHPRFRPMPDSVKMGLDNPDNYYVSASVNPTRTYRIRGHRGSIHYLSFAAQSQNFADAEKITGGAGHLNDADLECDDGGYFEITASQSEQPGNWLRMTPQTRQILVRQTFLDRSRERPVEAQIECLEAQGSPPPLAPERVPDQLARAAMYAIGAAQWFANWTTDFLAHADVNDFHLPDEEKHRLMGGDPNVRMWLGQWKLGPDEALIIEATPPDCHYWNFQLGNVWAESLDHENRGDGRRVHVNSGGAVYRDDGSFRLIVAHDDPGEPNWIDTAGHHHGTMALRWVRTDAHPKPSTRVVPLAELRR